MLNTNVKSPVYESRHGDAPYLESVCVMNQENETLTLFAVNKDLTDAMELSCDLRQFEGNQVREHIVLAYSDLKAVNTEEQPEQLAPTASGNARIKNGQLSVVLSDKSFNVIHMTK